MRMSIFTGENQFIGLQYPMKIRQLILFSSLLLAGCAQHDVQPLELCIGTYGSHYYRVTFLPDGTFSKAAPIDAVNASFVLPVGDDVVYAVSENDPHSGMASYRGTERTAFNPEIGGSPCYLMQVDNLPYIFTADYMGGSVSVFATKDGVVGQRVQHIAYAGSGPVVGRQEKAHVHQLKTIPAALCARLGIKDEWLLATDLGCDSIHVLKVNRDASSDVLTDVPALGVALPAGSGPRHMEFNERNALLYCLSELSGEVLVWALSASANGEPCFTPAQRLLADDAHAGGSADIRLHPNGRFLYTSHRLRDDGIVLFHVADDGLLTKVARTPTEGHPRHFLITPDGRYLLAACRDGHCVQVFAINSSDGTLTDTGTRLDVAPDGPVCVALHP